MNKLLITLILFSPPIGFLADTNVQSYNIVEQSESKTNTLVGNAEFHEYPQLERKTSNIRCKAITKKGTQCKRFAQKGSKYCWQHQKE